MEQSPSSSSSATKASTGEMVLKVQQSEGTRRSTRLSSVNTEGKRIVSVKKSKTKQKKNSAKVVSKIPKKPPTAFFYFLQSSEVTNCEGAIPAQSRPLDNRHDNKVTDSVIIVEDLTNNTPPGIPASKVVYNVSHIEDGASDDCSSTGETETGSSATASDNKAVTADGSHRHDTISDVAIAEVEAGIYGLQVESYYLD